MQPEKDVATEAKAIFVLDAPERWEGVRKRLAETLGIEVLQAASAFKGRGRLRDRPLLLALLAEPRRGGDLPSLMAEIREWQPFLPAVVISYRPTPEGAVAAMRAGAHDYLPAPLTWERLVDLLTPFLTSPRETGETSSRETKSGDGHPILTREPIMLRLLRVAAAVAPARATVLIQGDSGTGKELLARYLHAHSDRARGPFIAVNCASLPSGLLESELFGHEKGAFTGAVSRKLGKFEMAQNGTLLLDEICELHPHLQAKLLRVLQENEVERVGGHRPIPLDVRVIATTNQNLQEAMRMGRLREDIFYRLQVISLSLPPLRARPGDILLLAGHFLQRQARACGKGPLSFSPTALQALGESPWRGNVRELENTVSRGVLLAEGPFVQPQDLFPDFSVEESQASLGASDRPRDQPLTSLREMERRLIFQALAEADGNRTRAARLLGISVRTLRNKLHEYRSEPFPRPRYSSQVSSGPPP